ncbi:hypothetical protein AN964_18335 [Heyndrickxia shackletonii]|uniref:Uncharacterized protein n=1 Tax=Heyndrickxia shackletonii TaxID=157838 RepID=A0A0Q3X038_9BACI|nr:hypothetical protein AN964_18335 [Heyndrickxia shackletonii]
MWEFSLKKKLNLGFEESTSWKMNFAQISNNVFCLLKGKATAYMVYSYLNHRYNASMNFALPSISTIQ